MHVFHERLIEFHSNINLLKTLSLKELFMHSKLLTIAVVCSPVNS